MHEQVHHGLADPLGVVPHPQLDLPPNEGIDGPYWSGRCVIQIQLSELAHLGPLPQKAPGQVVDI